MKKNESKSIEKNYMYNLIYQMLVVIIPIIITPYVSRILTPEGNGAFSYTTAMTGYFALFGNLGVATYGQLKVAGLRDKKQDISKVFHELVLLRFILMAIVSLIFLGFIQVGSEERFKTLYYVLIVQIVAGAVDITWFLQGLEEFKKIVIRNTIIKVVSVILIFSFVRTQKDLYVYALILNGSTLLGNLSIWCFTPRYIDRIPFKELHPFSHLKSCIIYFIPTIATTIYLTLDKTMIGWVTTSSFENGYYEQAHKIEQMAVTVVTSISAVTMPRMAYLFQNNEISKLKKKLQQTIQFVTLVSIPMCLGMIAVSDYFIPLFLGPGYEKCIPLLRIFSLLIIVVGLNNAVGKQVLMPIGKQHSYNISVIIGAFVNFLTNYMLIPQFFSVGAAIASVVAETVILVIFMYFSKEYVNVLSVLKGSINYIVSATIMFVFIRISYSYLSMSWKSVVLQIFIGIITYATFIIRFKDKFIINSIKEYKYKIIKKESDE